MLHRVVFASVIGADITAFSIEGASLDDVLGAALVGLALGALDYVVVFDVAHLASDHPPKHSDQDCVACVLGRPFVEDGVALRAEPLPSGRG